jgi:hypothetical protein
LGQPPRRLRLLLLALLRERAGLLEKSALAPLVALLVLPVEGLFRDYSADFSR